MKWHDRKGEEMKHWRWVILAAGTECFCMIGCSEELESHANQFSLNPVIINESQAGKSVSVHPGQSVEIKLAANATTGYQWMETSFNTFSSSPAVLERIGSEYHPSQAGNVAVGTGGTYLSKFKAVEKGRVKITLKYIRPWESQTPAAKTLSFEIIVD